MTVQSYLTTDPRSACFYARRSIEELVRQLYDVLGLRLPYSEALAAMSNEPEFKRVTGNAINTKLNLIRTVGNDAVHKKQPMSPQRAVQILNELYHVMIWAAFRYSAKPESVPTGRKFDPALAQRMAPLSHDEVRQLAERLAAQDRAHADEIKSRDDLLADRETEIIRLRQEIEAAQAAKTVVDHHDYTEASTRDLFIDVLLGEAGWPLVEGRDREYRVTGMPGGDGYVDYVLWGVDGRPLGLVEAKRTTRSAQLGQQQASLYADALEREFGRRPVIFYTNGDEHWLWDDAAGYPPREVQGFYTAAELELLIQRRSTRGNLATAPINTGVAGRPYQVRAVRAVGDAFARKQREALLVMATGAGKTRTVVALIEQLMQQQWVKRVLFLADRTALVRQATNVFKAQLPSVSTVNLVTDPTSDGRVFTSTYPTMLNRINDTRIDPDGVELRRFGPGYFDLIVIDEAHRSVYAKYGAIFDYFDAMLVGLTATPKDEVDHNTYRLFHLEDGVPTDSYGLDDAVADGYLVPPWTVSVGTRFLRDGISYDDLSDDEKDEWDTLDWGDDGPPDEIGAEEINRFLFNEDTVDKVIANLMADGYKVAGGDRLGKTIIFSKNQRHAEFIQRRFDLAYPEYAGKFAQVITHGTYSPQTLIDDFSTPDKAPHIAISVDMLDTGIDIPEVVNLVFFKPVRSRSKFWQMIGRGTRLRPDLFGPGQDKDNFLVFDFCGNLEFFAEELPGSEGSISKSLSQRLFEARLGLLAELTSAGTDVEVRAEIAEALHGVVEGMNTSNVLVRPHRAAIRRLSDRAAWDALDAETGELALGLAGVPSTERDPDEQAKRFDLIVLNRELAQLTGDAVTAERCRTLVQEIATSLLGKTTIPSVLEQAELLEAVAGEDWWADVTLPMLEAARRRVRGLVQFVEKTRRNPIYTSFADEVGESQTVDLPVISTGVDLARFQAKARAFLLEHLDNISLQRLYRNRPLTETDLETLEGLLVASGGQAEQISREAERKGGLGLFIRSLVGLDRQAAQEAFAGYLASGEFTAEQIRYVDLIIDELTRNGVVEPRRLYESPYTDSASTGPEYIFTDAQTGVIVEILHDVRTNALA